MMEVIGLLTVCSIPTVIAIGQARSAHQKQQAAAKLTAKFNLLTTFSAQDEAGRWISSECFVVLKNGNVFLNHPAHPVQGHKFCGFYFDYPARENCQGLVSTIEDDSPMLNWIFVDKDTLELRYGNKTSSLGHIAGHWTWTDDEKSLILENNEGFATIEQGDGSWKLYYYQGGDGPVLPEGKMVKVCLSRQLL